MESTCTDTTINRIAIISKKLELTVKKAHAPHRKNSAYRILQMLLSRTNCREVFKKNKFLQKLANFTGIMITVS